jgi:hypothetical protein
LAAAGGEIHPAEIETIRIVAQHAGVNDDRLGEIWSWVKHGLEWMSEGPRLVEVPLKGD